MPAEDEEGTFFRTGAAGNDQLLNAGGASSAAFIDDDDGGRCLRGCCYCQSLNG